MEPVEKVRQADIQDGEAQQAGKNDPLLGRFAPRTAFLGRGYFGREYLGKRHGDLDYTSPEPRFPSRRAWI